MQGLIGRFGNLGIRDNLDHGNYTRGSSGQTVALACKMVGGGSDGSLDLCARVCLTDEYDNIIFHTYVKPPMPVTNYRYNFHIETIIHTASDTHTIIHASPYVPSKICS